MRQPGSSVTLVGAGVALLATACSDDDSNPGQDAGPDGVVDASPTDAGSDARPDGWPPPVMDRFCEGRPSWDDDLTPTAAPTLSGTLLGAYQGLPANTQLTMKIIPEHPFRLTTIRAAFMGDPGIVRFALTGAWGRSYPDPDDILLTAFDYYVEAPGPDTWEEIDVWAADLWLLPTQHYILVVITTGEMPRLAVEELLPGEWSRALMHVPGESLPWGSEGNFRLPRVQPNSDPSMFLVNQGAPDFHFDNQLYERGFRTTSGSSSCSRAPPPTPAPSGPG